MLTRARRHWNRWRTAALTVGGLSCVVVGLGQAWAPLGWIAAGAALVVVEWLGQPDDDATDPMRGGQDPRPHA